MNEEIKAASVDSPELEVLLRRVREAKSWDFDDRKAALIAHINAWGNQLAASRAMLPVTDSVQLLQNVVADVLPMLRGSGYPKTADVLEIATREVAASPVAGWVSVEERLPEIPADAKYSAYVNVLAAFKSDRVRPMRYAKNLYAKTEKGRAPRWEEWDGRLACGNPTHWQELPPAPAATPTQQNQQEQSNG